MDLSTSKDRLIYRGLSTRSHIVRESQRYCHILYINMNINELFPYPLCRGPTLKWAEFEVGRVVHKTNKGLLKKTATF